MNGDDFLGNLSTVLSSAAARSEVSRWQGTAESWTDFMTQRLVELAELAHMHVCARSLGTRTRHGANPDRHLAREFLFDFTMYEEHDWNDWSLPSIIVEHENYWSQAAFFQDFWKLLAGYAPLRVMIGYAGSPTGIDALTRAVMQHAVSSRWRYPPQTEDLVLLRSPTMAWPTWRVLRRDAESNSWKDSGTLLSDAVTV